MAVRKRSPHLWKNLRHMTIEIVADEEILKVVKNR